MNPDNRPTLQECERDEADQPPFTWNPSQAELHYWAVTDPWTPENQR